MSTTTRLTKVVALAAAAVMLVGCSSGSDDDAASSSTPDSPLYAAAKKEGKLTVYENVTPDIVDALKKGFEKKYPGIEVEKVRLPDSEMIPRLETELGSGSKTADYIENASPNWLEEQGAKGAWMPATLSPGTTFDSAAYLDPKTNVYEIGASVSTFAWNTDLVPDGLKDYEDLLDPKLAKGKVGVIELSSAPSNDFYIWLEKTFGEGTYIGIGAQKPRIYPSTTGIVEALGSGEIYATDWVVPSLLDEAKKAGAPVDYAISPTEAFGIRGYGVVNAKAKNPNAAQLYLDYVVSEEGQSIMWPTASSVLTPAPKGVLTTNDKLAPWDPDQSTPENVELGRTRWDTVYR